MATAMSELEQLEAEKAQLELEQLQAEQAELLAAEQEDAISKGQAPAEWVENLAKIGGAIASLPERLVSAPLRAAALPIAAEGLAGITKAPEAFKEQFGAAPEEAPSMREVMQVAGVPDTEIPLPEVEPAGLGIERASLEEFTGLPEEMRTPAKAPTSEILATGAEQLLDPTAALMIGAGRAVKGAKFLTSPIAAGAKGVAGAAGGLAAEGVKSGARGVGEIAGMAYKDIPTGMRAGRMAERGVEGIVEQVKSLPETVQKTFQNLKAEVRPQYIEQVNLAARTGIPDELITNNATLIYGPDAFITKGEKTRAQFGVSSEKNGAKSFDRLGQEINSALGRQVDKVVDRKVVDNQQFSGTALKKAYDRAVSDLFEDNKIRYSSLLENLPEGSKGVLSDRVRVNLQVKLQEMIAAEQDALELATQGKAKRVHRDNLRTLDAVSSNLAKSEGQIDRVVKQLQQIGREAYSDKYKGVVPNVVETTETKKLLKDLYGELQFAITSTVNELDPRLASELVKSNEAQTSFLNKARQFADILGNKDIAPESAYQRIILGGDSDMLKAANELLGYTDEFQQVKGQALLDFLKRDAKDDVSFIPSAKRLNDRRGKMIQQILFEPGELDDFRGLVTLGVDSGVKNINTSSTGVVNFIKAAFSNPLEAVESLATGEQFINVLKRESMKDYFKDMTVPQMLDMRGRGLIDDAMIDEVISDRMLVPEIKQAYQTAVKTGTLTPDVVSHLMTLAQEAPPVTTYSIIRDYMLKTGESMGLGLLPGSGSLERATKVLLFVNRMQRERGSVPVLIPEEDREAVRQAIMESGMTSIQKAKNMRSINSSGYLLNLMGFSPEEVQQERAIRRAQDQQKALLERQKAAELKEDRPDVLKRIQEFNQRKK